MEEDDGQFLLDNADNLDEESDGYMMTSIALRERVASCFQTMTADMLRGNVLLLDSCSTVNLITNKNMVHDVRPVKKAMRVRCNAGTTSTNLKGKLGSFPERVWYNPEGVANILSSTLSRSTTT